MLHTVNPVLNLESDRNAQRQAVRVLCYTTVPWKPTTGLPGGLDGKGSACNARDLSWTPWAGGSHGEGNGNPLQYSYLENSMDRGACWALVHRVAKSLIQTKVTWHSHSHTHTHTHTHSTSVQLYYDPTSKLSFRQFKNDDIRMVKCWFSHSFTMVFIKMKT